MPILLPHSSLEFKKNEVATLQYIQTRGFFDEDFNELAHAIYLSSERYKGLGKKSFDFNFVADFDMEIEEKIHRVVLHADVIGNYEFASYSIGVCAENCKELIRRFHFDYVHNNPGKKQKVPISHLQYGGTSSGGFTTNRIEHWLSEPRLNFPPINLALLLDLVFCEFSSEKTKKITEDLTWKVLIRDNETFALQQYYKLISAHIGTHRHTKETLVRDLCYA